MIFVMTHNSSRRRAFECFPGRAYLVRFGVESLPAVRLSPSELKSKVKLHYSLSLVPCPSDTLHLFPHHQICIALELVLVCERQRPQFEKHIDVMEREKSAYV